MKPLIRAIHFFTVVPPLPRLMLYSSAVVTGAATVALVLDPRRATSATLPILTLQIFATSTGFTTHAHRGHYDVLLTEGLGRVRTGLVQWAMAAAPGLASWSLIAIVELAVTDTRYSVESGTLGALFMVSTLPWAITVALPRFSGAIGWMLLSAMTRALAAPAALDSTWNSSDPTWMSTLRFVLFPARVAGVDIVNDLASVLPALIGAGLSMLVALAWIRRTPLPLESGQ